MNGKIQYIWNLVEQSNKLSQEEKDAMLKSLKDADKEISIAAFKIERLEKVKYTTTVLLEQTIEELESKRASVEKQKRELEIETALERVRARTMAMRHSDELSETAYILFQEFKQLGEDPIQITIGIFNEEQNLIEFRITGGDGSGSKIDQTFNASIDEPKLMNKMFKAWKQNRKSEVIVLQGKELIDWINYRNAMSGKYAHDTKVQSDDRRYVSAGFFSKGVLSISTMKALADETVQILERFASVFDLTYTRFLDLKNAEAHALQAEQDLIEIKAARKKAEDALRELKATQAQLIQSEKMASLGELTAGIAHEIQNPLNFVNNFAEINTELVDELKNELEKGNIEEVKFIATDLKDNNDKIAFHGKRAESIVKGMLQHSRTSTGKKELADINALADEFLRLSYHGLRAKDKSFNATMETNFDYNIEKVEIIPQDLGRVLLNLFNNAFYSVNEKKKTLNGLYEPKVFVSTEKLNGKIAIVVKDNGNGIPQKIIDKIYHPFFTTKPTGEGTGLGLSLSYDIITKGHNGELKVETKEGEFASFKIILPA